MDEQTIPNNNKNDDIYIRYKMINWDCNNTAYFYNFLHLYDSMWTK
jgi:hypothetical protein